MPYKGFDKGLKCREFQYKEGKEYKIGKKPIRCGGKGFHACDNPLDILNYYNLCDSEFAEVEALGDIDRTDANDTKFATNHIKIKTKIILAEFIQSSIDFLFSKTKKEPDESRSAQSGYRAQSAQSGNGAQSAQSGDGAQSAQSGDWAQSAQSGDGAQSAQSGNGAKSAQSGDGAQSAQSGNGAKSAQSGNWAQSAQSGDGAQSAQSGDGAQSAQSGNGAKSELSGTNSIAMACGNNSQMKGKKGNWIVLAEYNAQNNIIGIVSGKIDGKKIKEDVWYGAKGGKFVEV